MARLEPNRLYDNRRAKEILDPSEFPELQQIITSVKQAANDNVLRVAQVKLKTGFAVSTIWKYVQRGTMPPPIRIGPRSVGWLESEIDAVIAAHAFASRLDKVLDMQAFVMQLVAANSSTNRSSTPELIIEKTSAKSEPSIIDNWGVHDPLPLDETMKENQDRLSHLKKTAAIEARPTTLDRKTKALDVTQSKVVKKKSITVPLSPSLQNKTGRK